MNNTKPVAIPRDLKPGDRLWYSKTEYATVDINEVRGVVYWESEINGLVVQAEHPVFGGLAYRVDNGVEIGNETLPIIRIERIASAKPKKANVDRDAALILRVATYTRCGVHVFTKHERARLRAIARRLQKGTP